jgi:tripartite-type tricarboxylate transporter receptor subunit TctC
MIGRILTAALVLGSTLVAPARAEDKPLHIILGFPPGASSDIVTRLVADKMHASLARTVLVENKPGAGGILANMLVKNAPADGSTVLMTPLATMVAYPFSYQKLGYDPFKDYAPVAHVAAFQLALGVGANVPAKTLADYVALAKQGGNYGNFASAATGSLPHFFGLMFAQTAGLTLVHVPYKGTANVIEALYSGEIPAAVLPIADLGTLAQADKGRILASSGAARSRDFPDVPTFQESGYDIEGSAWYALFAPSGVPKDTVEKLARAAIDAVHAPDIQQKLKTLGLEPTGYGPDKLAAIVKADYDKWGPVIRASGFHAD